MSKKDRLFKKRIKLNHKKWLRQTTKQLYLWKPSNIQLHQSQYDHVYKIQLNNQIRRKMRSFDKAWKLAHFYDESFYNRIRR